MQYYYAVIIHVTWNGNYWCHVYKKWPKGLNAVSQLCIFLNPHFAVASPVSITHDAASGFRSEYCRNVKLKFCLEADALWSREFRERLQKPANEGGFSGTVTVTFTQTPNF